MCGITGYIGQRDAAATVLAGLRHLSPLNPASDVAVE